MIEILEFVGIAFVVCALVSYMEDPEGFRKCFNLQDGARKDHRA